jgi:hypothetical protein
MDERAQRYINIRVFREMARMVAQWKQEERSRHRAARLLVWLVGVALVAGTGVLVYLSH